MQVVQKAKQLQARLEGVAVEAAASPLLRQQLKDAAQQQKDSQARVLGNHRWRAA